MILSPPLRFSDFVNSQGALAQWMEELVALDRLPLNHVQPRPWGYRFSLCDSAPFRTWWTEQSLIQEHFLLKSVKLDRYGNRFLFAHAPGMLVAGLSTWPDLGGAAQDLRETIGRYAFATYREDILPFYSKEIIDALQIAEASLNSGLLPSHCALKWGKLLRIDSDNLERVLSYFLVEKPADCSLPLLVSLGANTYAVFAWSRSQQEPLRIGLCRNWHDDVTIKDLRRWIKSFTSRSSKETTN
jgi:hypothetical protein